jgi:hypothetical protein
MSKSKKCLKCNLEFSTKYKFCTECGQALKRINNCPECDVPVRKTSKFCTECGTNLQNVESDFISDSWEETPDSKKKESEYLTIGYAVSGFIFLLIVIGIFIGISGDSEEFLDNIPSNPGVTFQDLQQLQQQQQNFERQQQFLRDAKQFNDCTQAMTQLGLNTFLC